MAATDASLLGGWVAKWSYRLGLHGKLRITTHEIDLHRDKHLPAPLVLAFASDFHAGPTTHPDAFTKLVEEINSRKPDVVLLGGDYVSSQARQVDVLANTLAQCRAPLGKFGVFGNHDLWTDDAYIARSLSSAGVRILINQHVALPAPFHEVSICGIDDPWTGAANVAQTFDGAHPIRIFLTHSPDGLLLLQHEQFDVGFAGHTHGGQVALPGGTPIITGGGPLSRKYSRGRFDIPGRGPLIVSRGVGCSTLPIRVHADPELIFCTLRTSTS